MKRVYLIDNIVYYQNNMTYLTYYPTFYISLKLAKFQPYKVNVDEMVLLSNFYQA